jgi:hypothetical protein
MPFQQTYQSPPLPGPDHMQAPQFVGARATMPFQQTYQPSPLDPLRVPQSQALAMDYNYPMPSTSTSRLHAVPPRSATMSVHSSLVPSLNLLPPQVNYRTYSNPPAASHPSLFGSGRASIASREDNPYEQLAPLQPVTLSSPDRKVLVDKLAHRFALILINHGPTLANEDQKALMCMDAFLELKAAERDYREILDQFHPIVTSNPTSVVNVALDSVIKCRVGHGIGVPRL